MGALLGSGVGFPAMKVGDRVGEAVGADDGLALGMGVGTLRA